MPRHCSSNGLTAEERAIVDALRACPESELSLACPLGSPLSMAAVAYLEGMTEGEVRHLLTLALRHLAAGIGRDPELLELVKDYYTQINHE